MIMVGAVRFIGPAGVGVEMSGAVRVAMDVEVNAIGEYAPDHIGAEHHHTDGKLQPLRQALRDARIQQ